jgi:hypothetical protein
MINRYSRHVAGESDDIEVRIKQRGLDHYWDASGGLHVRCTQGELWTMLSGEVDTIFTEQGPDEETQPEWISVLDLGAIWSPPLPTSSVLKLLRDEGLLKAQGRRSVPTEAASGLYEEREAVASSQFPSTPGAVQRRWSYEVVERLRERHDEVESERAKRPPKAPPTPVRRRLTAKWATTCEACSNPITVGDSATWDSGTRRLTCERCEAARSPA